MAEVAIAVHSLSENSHLGVKLVLHMGANYFIFSVHVVLYKKRDCSVLLMLW
jgi:hypothetical protein